MFVRRLLLRRALLLLALAGRLAGPEVGRAASEEELWQLLAGGRQAVLVRHAVTTPGVGDPPGMRLEDCATQRNLTEEGRAHSRRLGAALRARGIPLGRVLSSPWCRCLETARLAFGPPEVWPPLANLFGRPENREEQVRRMRELVGGYRGRDNLILVTHGSTISALTGVHPDAAEMVVLTPRAGGSFRLAGRLSVR